MKNKIREVLADEENSGEVEYTLTFPDGKQHFEGHIKRINKNLAACFEINITLRKHQELALRQNEELLTAILDNMPTPVMVKNIDTT